jgi:hypothetical protein
VATTNGDCRVPGKAAIFALSARPLVDSKDSVAQVEVGAAAVVGLDAVAAVALGGGDGLEGGAGDDAVGGDGGAEEGDGAPGAGVVGPSASWTKGWNSMLPVRLRSSAVTRTESRFP